MHFCHFLYRLLGDKIQIACFLYRLQKNRKIFSSFSSFMHPMVNLHALEPLLQLSIRKCGSGEQILHIH
jgi:hypothetical protein